MQAHLEPALAAQPDPGKGDLQEQSIEENGSQKSSNE